MFRKLATLSLTIAVLLPFATLAQRSRIAGRVDNARRFALRGHLHPKALPENDQGPVDPSLRLSRVSLVLQPSASQQADLDQLLAEQQDPSSANYHHWLTPEQYADRFGASQDDVNKITAWLQSQNLTVVDVARGRSWVAVSGTAASVERAFQTQIHHYLVNGELHFANDSAPSIPAALQGVVAAIHGLDNFRMKPARRAVATPDFTSGSGRHYLGPDDLGAIYNIQGLHSSGFTGSGQKLVVVGQTQIKLADIDQYRTYFNLPANDPQVVLVPNSRDPGVSLNDMGEADLDIEIAGAVAPDATIVYVYSNDVMTSLQYAIDQNLAPVISMSYGSCEAENATSDATTLRSWARQGNAQGITWFAASGDSGGTDCYVSGSSRSSYNYVASVDLPASVPEVTGVGGTTFSEGSGSYWSAGNSGNNASASGYIPETAWNDSAANGSPTATGGGASIFFSKPTWQTGPGVPADNARNVPDVALSASADHDGYLTFTNGKQQVVGGTSAGAPGFSGLAVLLNQALTASGAQAAPGLGNINPKLYSLAQTAPAAFHDITSGDNIINVICTLRARNCTAGPVGFSAGSGYDPVTGLGSVDAYALLTVWLGGTPQRNTAPPGAPPQITGVLNGASYDQTYAPGMILWIFGQQLSPVTQTAAAAPFPTQAGGVTVTVNGIAAPLWVTSPGLLIVQLPYETPVGTPVVLTVTNNGQSVSSSLVASAAAPGIFTDPQGAPRPSASGSRGGVIQLYMTGAGVVSPATPDGAAPPASAAYANLPQPLGRTSVTVGGIDAPIQFIGIPWNLVGVVQINYQVPAAAPLGAQPVVVTVGGVASKPAMLTVTP